MGASWLLYRPSSKMSRIMSDSMTCPVPRSALASDAVSIAGCVREAYSPCIKRIGKPPGLMLESYDAWGAQAGCAVASGLCARKELPSLTDRLALLRNSLGRCRQLRGRADPEHRNQSALAERRR